MKFKRILFLFMIIVTLCSLVGCGNSSSSNANELLKTPFIMEIHKTYLNGAYYNNYPEKVFNTDELFNLLNAASADGPFDVIRPAIRYHIEMINGDDFTSYELWNDGSVTMSFNLLNTYQFYLTADEYQAIVDLLES